MSLRTILSNYGFVFQRELFPTLEEELGPLGERYELFVTVLGFVPVEPFLTCWRGCRDARRRIVRRWHEPSAPRRCSPSRPPARSSSALSSTGRCVACAAGARRGGPQRGDLLAVRVPSATSLDSTLPSRLHEALIDKTLRDHLVGHVSRDSTAILGREKPAPKPHQAATPKRRRGRPRKGEQRLDKAPRSWRASPT